MNWFRDLWNDIWDADGRFLAAAFLVALGASALVVGGLALFASPGIWGARPALALNDGQTWLLLLKLTSVLAPGALLLGVPLAVRLRTSSSRHPVGAGALWGALLGVFNAPLVGVGLAAWTLLEAAPTAGDPGMLLASASAVAVGVLFGGVCVGAPCGAVVGALLGALAHWWPGKPGEGRQ